MEQAPTTPDTTTSQPTESVTVEITEIATVEVTETVTVEDTPMTSNPSMTSFHQTTQSSTNGVNGSLYCYCSLNKSCETKHYSEEELAQMLQILVQELKVSIKDTNAYRRRLISAPDDRPSAQRMGAWERRSFVWLFSESSSWIFLASFIFFAEKTKRNSNTKENCLKVRKAADLGVKIKCSRQRC